MLPPLLWALKMPDHNPAAFLPCDLDLALHKWVKEDTKRSYDREDIITHHHTFLEDTLSPPTQCYRAHCQVHVHSLLLVSKFCPPHKEPHILATKFPRQTWWRNVWGESCVARMGLVH